MAVRAQAAPRAPVLLAASAVAVPHTGTLTKTALATITIPAGSMGLNGGVHIVAAIGVTSSANSKTLNVEFGGTQIRNAAVTTAGRTFNAIVRNRGVSNSQIAFILDDAAISSAAAAVNSSSAVNITINGTLTNTGETITLESYEVWLTP